MVAIGNLVTSATIQREKIITFFFLSYNLLVQEQQHLVKEINYHVIHYLC